MRILDVMPSYSSTHTVYVRQYIEDNQRFLQVYNVTSVRVLESWKFLIAYLNKQSLSSFFPSLNF